MIPVAPSVIAFAAASLAYVASEVMGGKDQDKFHNRQMADMEMMEEKLKGTGAGGGGEIQRETLKMALEEERDLLAIINKRKKWTSTVSSMYKAAAGLAAIELALSLIPNGPKFIVKCSPGLLTGTAGLVQKALVGAWAFTKVSKGDMMGGLAVAVGAAIPAVGVPISMALKTPATRIATFGVASMLVGKSKSDLEAAATTAQQNIDKIQSVLDQFDANSFVNESTANTDTSGPDATGGAGSGSGGLASGGNDLSGTNVSTAVGSTNPSALPTSDGSQSANCFTQTSQGIDYSSNCVNPLVIAEPSFDGRIEIPTLRDATSQSLKFTNAIARGDIAGADAAAAKIDCLAGKIREATSAMKKKANERLVASGQKAIDFEKEEREIAGQIDAAVSKSGQGNSSSALAALSASDLSGSGANGSEDKDASAITTASSNEKIDLYGAGKGQGSGTEGLYGNISEGGLTNSDSAISEGDLSASKSLEDSLNEYESSVDDISKRTEDSIFKQVSMRYQANYDRFFERKKPRPEPMK